MNNKMKYVEEVLKLDVSMLSEYFDKLETLMAKYIGKQYAVAVSSTYVMDIRISKLLEESILFDFKKDKKFIDIEGSFIIASDNKDNIEQIKEIVYENEDTKMNSVMVAMAIADAEDILKNR